ncbi:MAG: 6-carboxytetrahydropterin synthase QueD [Spirochaetes bacterium]|nr:MAG: 6-carboxytetrahydropterin synthase QueD [Spirochaetota bacterium]
MYILTVEDSFASAHQLNGYKGKCENLHGHNWRVVVSVRGRTLNKTGLLIDFHDLKALLKPIIAELDHKNLNELPFFRDKNPSSENIAAHIALLLGDKLSGFGAMAELESVVVWESDTSRCTYIPER